ncbi:hypothetical protein U8V72_14355 [Priestia filamentosa]|uniref:hypothetical protein n=1 Tax=Priestia filamentosa TaxID=1402861 RepID=UPI00397824FB
MPKGKKYEKYIDEWKRLYEEGKSFRQIADIYGIQSSVVTRSLKDIVEVREKSPFNKYAEEWRKLHIEEGYSRSEIARMYNTGPSTISHVLHRKLGIGRTTKTNMGLKKKYEHLTKTFIKMYEEGYSLKEIGKKHEVSSQTVSNYIKEGGGKLRTMGVAQRKYEVNDDYFNEIDTEEKAYHLGILFAKGTLLKDYAGFVIQIVMHQDDWDLIHPVIKALRGKDTGLKKGGYVPRDGYIRYRFHSEVLYDRLKEHGLNARYKESLPSLKNSLYPAFFAGFFLLRGSLSQENEYFKVQFSRQLLTQIKEVLENLLQLKHIEIKGDGEKKATLVITDSHEIDSLFEWIDVF